jgi:hypothetical protein
MTWARAAARFGALWEPDVVGRAQRHQRQLRRRQLDHRPSLPRDPPPTASNLNFGPGQVRPNLVVVPLGPDGEVSFANANGTTDLIVDIFGYYAA